MRSFAQKYIRQAIVAHFCFKLGLLVDPNCRLPQWATVRYARYSGTTERVENRRKLPNRTEVYQYRVSRYCEGV
jgi:hypothetical protein